MRLLSLGSSRDLQETFRGSSEGTRGYQRRFVWGPSKIFAVSADKELQLIEHHRIPGFYYYSVGVLLLSCAATVSSFKMPSLKVNKLQYLPVPMKMVKTEQGIRENQVAKQDPLVERSVMHVTVPSSVDLSAFPILFLGQGCIFAAAVILSLLCGVNPTTNLSFDTDSLLLGLKIAAPVTAASLLLRGLPTEPFRKNTRNLRAFTLRLFGRDSNPWDVALWLLLLSVNAGISEEFLFRGFLFNFLNTGVLGLFGILPLLPWLVSALIFALVHYPLTNVDMKVEFVLGLIFAYAFSVSGTNLIVPIIVHAIYDFVMFFSTWLAASQDLNMRIDSVERKFRLEQQPSEDRYEELADLSPKARKEEKDTAGVRRSLEAIASATFDWLDENRDGYIGFSEYAASLRMMGAGTVPLSEATDSPLLESFSKLDSNHDGFISFDEYFTEFEKKQKARTELLEY